MLMRFVFYVAFYTWFDGGSIITVKWPSNKMYRCTCNAANYRWFNGGLIQLWSETTVNAAAKCDPMGRQGSSIRGVARQTLVTVCDKFQLVRCSQSVVSYGWEKVCYKVCCKSWITNNALTWNFVSNCKNVLKKHTKC